MEQCDRELILLFMKSDVELRKLYERHLELEEKLDEYSNDAFTTADQEMEIKRLKKEKLIGVDRMMGIISGYRMGSGLEASLQ